MLKEQQMPGPSSSPSPQRQAICTLFEGDYHFGLAALINSLARAGYAGTVWAGYRGPLPPWIDQLKRLEARGEYGVNDRIRLVLLPLELDLHFANYKPQFMLDLLADRARDCEYIWYFDPDIFLLCNWSFFAGWSRHGVALCQEVILGTLPEDAPFRHAWMEIVADMGLGKPRALNRYFNSGMVGVAAADAGFLHLWKRVLDRVGAMGYDLKAFMPGNRELDFYTIDQDALNIAAMYSEHPLSTMGPEAMGFVPGGFTMYHVQGRKPWRISPLREALAGRPPSNAVKYFFTQVSSPIRAYSALHLRAKKLGFAIAAFIGRSYRRY
jgi:hypothetical protein